MKQRWIMLVSMALLLFAGTICQARNETIELKFADTPVVRHGILMFETAGADRAGRLSVPGRPEVPMISRTYRYPSGTIVRQARIESFDSSVTLLKQALPLVPPRPTVDRRLVRAPMLQAPAPDSVFPESWISMDVRHGLDPETLEPTVFATVRVFPARIQGFRMEYLSSIRLSFDVTEPPAPAAGSSRTAAGLMIVAPQAFIDVMTPYFAHKQFLGINIIDRSLEDIEANETGRDTAEKIKYALHHAFQDSQIRNVILAGDASLLPVRYTFHAVLSGSEDWLNTPSELYYADLYDRNGLFCDWDANANSVFGEYIGGNADGCDFMPDVLIGRIPAADTTELQAALSKIVNYESTVTGSEDWQNRVVLVGADTFTAEGHSEYSGIPEGEATKECIAAEFLTGYELVKLYETDRYAKTGTCSTQTVLDAFQNGARYINYANHGSVTAWAFPGGLTCDDVMTMTNYDKLPVAFGYACLTGAFDTENSENPWGGNIRSFAEAIMLNPDGGSVAYFGATRTAFAGGFGMGGHTACMGYLDRAFFQGVAAGHTNQGRLYLYTVADFLCNLGLQSANDFITVLEFIYFGDPTLNAGGSPGAADFSIDLTGIDDSITGDGDGCAEAEETADLHLYLSNDGVAVTSANIDISSSDPEVHVIGGSWYLADLPRNTRVLLDPYCSLQIDASISGERMVTLDVRVVCSEGDWSLPLPVYIGQKPFIQADRLVVTEDPNNDGFANPGEQIRFSPVMMNTGCAVANGLTAQLELTDEYVMTCGAYQAQKNPDIRPGESRYSDKIFYATIDPMAPHDHTVNCHITISHPDSGGSWVFDLPLVLKDYIKPIIENFQVAPDQPMPGEPATITVRAMDGSGVSEIKAILWSHDTGTRTTVELFDDGNHQDGEADDDVFGATLTLPDARAFFIADIYARDGNGNDGTDYRKGSISTIPFIAQNPILVVGGADGDLYLGLFTQALEDSGYAYDVWSSYRGVPPDSVLDQYTDGALIWFFSHTFPMLEKSERDAVDHYLAGGGNLLITEQDIGWYLVESGSPETEQWYRDTLLAEYVTDAVSEKSIEGSAGDEFSNGLEFSIDGGSGAQNQQWPSQIEPIAPAVTCLKYKDFSGAGTGTAAVRADRNGARHIYMAFGFEGISSQADRRDVMDAAMQWFGVEKQFGVCPWRQSPGWWIGPEIPVRGIYAPSAYCASDRRIYRSGGNTGNGSIDASIYYIDTDTNQSGDTGVDLPANVFYNATACLHDGISEKVYFFGGLNKNYKYLASIQVYDPLSGTISTLESDSIPDDMLGCPTSWAVSDNRFYLISSGLLAAPYQICHTWVFDPMAPAGTRWINLNTSLGLDRMFSATAVVDGKIYAIGGIGQIDDDHAYAYSRVEVLDTRQESPAWDDAAAADLPEPAAWIGAVGIPMGANVPFEGQIITGGSFYYAMENGYLYDPETDTWREYWPTHVTRWLSSQLIYVPSARGPELWITEGFDQIVYGYTEILHLNPEPEGPWIGIHCRPEYAPGGSEFAIDLDIAGDRSATAVDCYICMEVAGSYYFMTMDPVFPSFTTMPLPLFSSAPLNLEIEYSGPLMVIPLPEGLPSIPGVFYTATLKSGTAELAGGFAWSMFEIGG